MNVFTISKDFKDKNKKANCWNKIRQKFNLSAGQAEANFRNIRTAHGRYRIQKLMFSTVLELTTTSLHDKQKK